MGWSARLRGDPIQAAARVRDSLVLFQQIGAQWGLADSLEGAAGLLCDARHFEPAAQLLGTASAVRDAGRIHGGDHRALRLANDVKVMRSYLGEAVFEAAWEAGRAIEVSQAVSVALATLATAWPAPASPA